MSPIFGHIFNLSLKQRKVPEKWKTSCIVPSPKKPNVSVMNDLRPIALTCCIMKVFERCIIVLLCPEVSDFIDKLQFAYQKNRGVDDAILHVLNNIYSHLEKTDSSIRIMFFDFSSAFNTIQPHLLAKKLCNMNVTPSLIIWILDYLTNRPQYVRIKADKNNSVSQKDSQVDTYIMSDTLFTNVGCPQGTCAAPFLFCLYTSDFRTTHNVNILDKYADDAAMTGLIFNNDASFYLDEIDKFVTWCDDNYLELNVPKVKEMCIDFRKETFNPELVVIKGTEVERVDTYRYLGLIFDNKA